MRWYTADFDALGWHDVGVHGFRIVDGENGSAELQLDIDFILEIVDTGAGGLRFLVAQAMLQFHEVFGLRLALDYVACSAGTTPFSIGAIRRESLRPPADDGGEVDDHGPWRWRIEVNWPEGFLEFEASGFTQWLVGDPREQDMPTLASSERL